MAPERVDFAVLGELGRLYDEVARHAWVRGDRYLTPTSDGIVGEADEVPEGAVWCPDLEDLLTLIGRSEDAFALRLEPVGGEVQKPAVSEWVAEGGEGRHRRRGRGRGPWEATSAWLIAHRSRPL